MNGNEIRFDDDDDTDCCPTDTLLPFAVSGDDSAAVFSSADYIPRDNHLDTNHTKPRMQPSLSSSSSSVSPSPQIGKAASESYLAPYRSYYESIQLSSASVPPPGLMSSVISHDDSSDVSGASVVPAAAGASATTPSVVRMEESHDLDVAASAAASLFLASPSSLFGPSSHFHRSRVFRGTDSSLRGSGAALLSFSDHNDTVGDSAIGFSQLLKQADIANDCNTNETGLHTPQQYQQYHLSNNTFGRMPRLMEESEISLSSSCTQSSRHATDFEKVDTRHYHRRDAKQATTTLSLQDESNPFHNLPSNTSCANHIWWIPDMFTRHVSPLSQFNHSTHPQQYCPSNIPYSSETPKHLAPLHSPVSTGTNLRDGHNNGMIQNSSSTVHSDYYLARNTISSNSSPSSWLGNDDGDDNRGGHVILQSSPCTGPISSSMLPSSSTSKRSVVESVWLDDTSFQVSVKVFGTTVREVMNIIANPEFLPLWCEPLHRGVIITKCSDSASTTHLRQPETTREYDGEWIEATSVDLISPASHVTAPFDMFRALWNCLGFPTFAKIIMFVERLRGQIGLTMGPFPGGVTCSYTIQVMSTTDDDPTMVTVLDTVKIQLDDNDDRIESPLLCGADRVSSLLRQCFLPPIQAYMEQSTSSLSRLRVLIEHGETGYCIVEANPYKSSSVPLLG